jgi:hypothetical protein
MKLKTTIITFLIACNSLVAQNSDLFYKKTETKQVPTSNATSKNAILTGGQKPFHLNILYQLSSQKFFDLIFLLQLF